MAVKPDVDPPLPVGLVEDEDQDLIGLFDGVAVDAVGDGEGPEEVAPLGRGDQRHAQMDRVFPIAVDRADQPALVVVARRARQHVAPERRAVPVADQQVGQQVGQQQALGVAVEAGDVFGLAQTILVVGDQQVGPAGLARHLTVGIRRLAPDPAASRPVVVLAVAQGMLDLPFLEGAGYQARRVAAIGPFAVRLIAVGHAPVVGQEALYALRATGIVVPEDLDRRVLPLHRLGMQGEHLGKGLDAAVLMDVLVADVPVRPAKAAFLGMADHGGGARDAVVTAAVLLARQGVDPEDRRDAALDDEVQILVQAHPPVRRRVIGRVPGRVPVVAAEHAGRRLPVPHLDDRPPGIAGRGDARPPGPPGQRAVAVQHIPVRRIDEVQTDQPVADAELDRRGIDHDRLGDRRARAGHVGDHNAHEAGDDGHRGPRLRHTPHGRCVRASTA